MRITEVRYERLFNTGNYNNQKIGLTATVEEGESPATVLDQLRTLVADHDPELVEARAIVADPANHRAWEVQNARKLLGLPDPPAPAPSPAHDDGADADYVPDGEPTRDADEGGIF